MTQPTSVNMTFDTSLEEVNPRRSQYDKSSALNNSFSTTESDVSDIGPPLPTSTANIPTDQLLGSENQDTPKISQGPLSPTPNLSPGAMLPPRKTSTPIQHLPTQDAYDAWASIYDTDGNMLQAIDDLELLELLPDMLTRTLHAHAPDSTINILDLGCGTGRNTAKLLAYSWPKHRAVKITGLDFSKGMLEVARRKMEDLEKEFKGVPWRLEQADCFPTSTNSNASPLPSVPNLPSFDAVTSTLVLEHIPLQSYFATLSSLLSVNGFALVTNMHSEMGLVSQAGFVREDGVKVRGESYAHTVKETAEEAQRCGFEVLYIREREMKREDIESARVSARGTKWIGVRVWYGMLLRKSL